MRRLVVTAALLGLSVGAGGAEFVTRQGPNLMLGGRPFMYAGANNYYVGIDNFIGAEPDTAVIDEIVADCQAMQLNCLRVWGFNDHDTAVEPWWTEIKAARLQTGLGGVVYQRDRTHGGVIDGGVDYFRGLDYLLDRAAASGLRVILPLVNNWQDYGGMAQYVQWSTGAAIPDADAANTAWRTYKNAFYTDPAAQTLYRAFAGYLADRVNTCNGRTYKADPTILAWQLANEPRMATYAGGSHAALDAWVAGTADYLKNTVGVSQLVTVGMEGYYADAARNAAAGGQGWFQYEGTDYLANHAHAAVDLAGFHLYQEQWGLSDAEAGKWIADHIRAARGAALNRPAILDEAGYKSTGETGPRNEHFKQYFRTAYRNMASGVNFWIAYHDAYPDYDQYGVYHPADADTVDIVARYGGKVRVFNKTGVHQLVAFEYDLDGFGGTGGTGALSVVRADGPTWFVTGDGSAEIACSLTAGDAFTAGAELIDEMTGAAGLDASGFGYTALLGRVLVADQGGFDPGELTIELYDRTDGTTRTGGGVTIDEAGRWYELTWPADEAGDLADLAEIGIAVQAAGDYTGSIYVDFIGGDLTLPGDNAPAPGDANWDDRVSYLDLGVLATNYGATGAAWYDGDFTGEGRVSYLDLGILATHYGWAASGAAAGVPEPATIVLLAAMCLIGPRRATRRQTGHPCLKLRSLCRSSA